MEQKNVSKIWLAAPLALVLVVPFLAPAEAQAVNLFQDWPAPQQVPAKPVAKPVRTAAKPAEKPAAKPAKVKAADVKSKDAKGKDKTAEAKKDAKKDDPKAKDAKAPTKPGDAKSVVAKAAEGKSAAETANADAKPIAPASAVVKATAGAAAAATATVAAVVPSAPLDRAEAIKRAQASLNASPVMTADFVQIGGDGRRAEGKLFIHKIGRMRFEYAQPATMEVVSDGSQVAVRDRKLKTQDLYFIAQTPLKFLLNEKIDLEKDVKLVDVIIEDSGVSILIEDKATLGGTSKIKLVFDAKTFDLKQWQVSDPQGYETLVTLFNIDRSRAPDPGLFKIARESLIDIH
jgi:outer membrane lipoprotein-sorting protein